jgi:hypothetical protein
MRALQKKPQQQEKWLRANFVRLMTRCLARKLACLNGD